MIVLKRIWIPTPLLWATKRVRFRIEHILIQADDVRLREGQIVVLERLGRPEAFHPIGLQWHPHSHIIERGMGDVRPGVPLHSLKNPLALLLQEPVARDAVENEDRLDRFRPQDISAIGDFREARTQAALADEILNISGRIRWGALPDRRVPGPLVPRAGRLARSGVEDLGHDARGRGAIGPDAFIHELAGDRKILRPVKNPGADANHASGKTGKMLALGLKLSPVVFDLYRPGHEDVKAVSIQWPEEEVLLCGFDGRFVHVAAFQPEPTEQQVLFGKVFVERVREGSEAKVSALVQSRDLSIEDDWPQPWQLGRHMLAAQQVRDALSGVEVLGVARELRKARESSVEEASSHAISH